MVLAIHVWEQMRYALYIKNNIDWSVFLQFGGCGVDLFFCISGFCLFLPVVTKWAKGEGVDWKRFYYRRILRIYPGYIVAVLLTAPLLGWLGADHPRPWYQIVTHLLWLHPALPDAFSGLPAMWSLGVEEWFYFSFALWVFIMLRKPVEGAIIGFAFALLFRQALVYFGFWEIGMWQAGLLSHIGHFLGGMLVASLYHRYKDNSLRWQSVIALVGLSFLFACPFLHRWGVEIPTFARWWGDVWLVIPMACLIFVCARGNNIVATLFSWKPIVYLGTISYSLYLFHYPVIYWLKGMLNLNYAGTYGWWAIMFTVPIVIGAAGYALVEAPFLALRERLRSDDHSSASSISRAPVVLLARKM